MKKKISTVMILFSLIFVSFAFAQKGREQTSVNITVKGQTIRGVLYDTALAKEIANNFPITLRMHGYIGREYYGSLNFKPKTSAKGQYRFDDGDITYCAQNNSIAIFYAQTNQPNLTMEVVPIGRVISDLSVFKSFAGTENFKFEIESVQKLKYQTDAKDAPVVYFTRDISAAGLMKVYNALNQKKDGKVGIKVSFGAPDEDVLKPSLLTELIKTTDGTMIDSCGLSGNRLTPEMNLSHARKHGFDKVGKMQMLDEKSDIDMPVKNGYLLKYARTGSHFNEYDTLVSVFKFRMHFLPALDGAIKNVTLCLGSRSGKSLIHSGGTDPNRYHDTKPDVLARAFADALRAALDYKKNWAFINVIDSYEPEDNCKGAKNTGDIGIIASVDPVALDQCSVDFVAGAAETEELRAQWEEAHQVKVLEYAENLGCGKRHYRLVEIK